MDVPCRGFGNREPLSGCDWLEKHGRAQLTISFPSVNQFLVGFASFFMLTPGPSQTKTKWFPNGLFTDREVKIITNRIVREGELLFFRGLEDSC